MHFINNSVLIVFDDLLRRLSYFDKNGNYLKDTKLTIMLPTDIKYYKGKYYLSTFLLKKDYKPIPIFDENFNQILKFGEFIPFRKNLFEDLERLSKSVFFERVCSAGNYTTIIPMENCIFYAQANPYKILKNDYDGNLLKNFQLK